MAHFAKVNRGVVVEVICASENFQEQGYHQERLAGYWLQTSYNTKGGVHYDPATGQPSADQSQALRKNHAGVGSLYDKDRDAFMAPQPYPSWTLNEITFFWEPPVKEPNQTEGKKYSWDEANQNWVEAAAA